MSRRSRRNQGLGISLFSFQDVMMTVMGILILMTLLMSLELTNAVAEANKSPASSEAFDTTDVHLLEQTLDRLSRQYKRTSRRVNRLAEMTGASGPQQLAKWKKTLERRYAEIDRLQKQVARLKKSLPAKVDRLKRAQAAQAKAKTLEAKADRLRDQLDHPQANPHLRYILQPGQHKQPILCVVSAKRIGIGTADASQPALWLTQDDPQAQLLSLKRLLDQCRPDHQFVVLLLKPSAFNERFANVCETIKSSGLEFGLDLIEEKARVLPTSH